MEPSPKQKYVRTDPKLAAIRKSSIWAKTSKKHKIDRVAKAARKEATRKLAEEIANFYKGKKK